MKRHSDGDHQARSLMIVSSREAFADVMCEVFSEDENQSITRTTESFTAMNGRAVSLAFDHDVVILEADPDDEAEVEAIRELLSHRKGETVFLALTRNDVSIAKARQLRDIGLDEVLPLSIDGDSLRAVVEEQMKARQAPVQYFHDGPAALGKVIPVTQARGGAGATTVAVNLACALAAKRGSLFRKSERSRVVLLDFDLQFGNANVFLDLEDNGGFLQVIEATEEPDAHFLTSTLQSHALGVDILCAPTPIVPLQSLRSDLIETILDILKKQYDYIVVDLPSAVVDWVEPVLKQAERLVMVTDTSVPCVRQARRLVDLFREDNVGLPVEFVVNRENRPMIKSEHVREAEKVLEARFQHWLPDNPRVARNAANLGRPVVDIKPRSDLGKALTKLAVAISVEEKKRTKANR